MLNDGGDDRIDELVVKLRADTGGFLAGVAEVQRSIDGPLAAGIDRAGAGLQRSLGRALADGKLGFDDLRRIAVSTLGDIAQQALQLDLGGIFGGGGSGGRGGSGLLGSLFGSLLGAPGRATGGPVSAGRAYMVGERGPELFVPSAAGRVEANGSGRQPLSITVNVAMPRDASPAIMQQTGNQVARAVARTLDRSRP